MLLQVNGSRHVPHASLMAPPVSSLRLEEASAAISSMGLVMVSPAAVSNRNGRSIINNTAVGSVNELQQAHLLVGSILDYLVVVLENHKAAGLGLDMGGSQRQHQQRAHTAMANLTRIFSPLVWI